jgi:hypothetical protein
MTQMNDLTTAALLTMIKKITPLEMAKYITDVQPMTATAPCFWSSKLRFPQKPPPKYQFSRNNWYIATFEGFTFIEVHSWCIDQFGPPGRPDAWSRWQSENTLYMDGFRFRDEKDYAWFVLKWS